MNKFLQMLIESLQLLAENPEKQREYLLQPIEVSVDELALNFDGAAVMGPQMLQNGEITKAQYDAIVEVDQYLNSISGEANSNLWTTEALFVSEEWVKVRELSKNALKSLESQGQGLVNGGS